MSALKSILTAYKPTMVFMLACLFILTFSRLLIVIWLGERIGAEDINHIFMSGIRMDVVFTCLLVSPIPFLVIKYDYAPIDKITTIISSIWLTLTFTFLVFMEVATPQFIQEYDLRPNRLFTEYLASPKEVIGMLVEGYIGSVIAGGIAIIGALYIGWKLFRSGNNKHVASNILLSILISASFVVLITIGARSGFQNRPANPSSVAFSSDPLLNTLPLSSGYNMLYSFYRSINERSTSELYPDMALAKIKTLVQENKNNSKRIITDKNNYNLVIIIQESFGAQFVKELGGMDLAPNIDKLKQESWWFENAYATGTRSARGLEAIITGFPPSPAKSVLKRPKSQQDFFTLAKLLKTQGYSSSFIYGGESHFDNMKGFFLNNGFDYAIDQNDYPNPKFTGNWGVSDEDLFDKAHNQFNQVHDKPFFSVVFSSSNHSPWQYPEGKIEPYTQEKQTRENAVKYADYALGEYLKKAKQSNYWKNTLFLIVADHDSRVHGSQLVPIDRFHIPAMILGANIKPKIDTRIISQIDLAPTLLSLLGINVSTPMIGRDLTQKQTAPGRAIMQYGDNQAYMEGNDIVIMQPGKKINQFNRSNGTLIETTLISELADKALAHALWPDYMYYNRLYR